MEGSTDGAGDGESETEERNGIEVGVGVGWVENECPALERWRI